MLNGKTIVVTGVASGIGAATARLLKEQGALVIGLDRDETSENVDQFVKIDLASQQSIDDAVAKIGKIDGICNIAGLPPTLEASLVMKVNFIAVRYLTERLIGNLNDNGAIVNVASLAGIGWPESVAAIKDTLANITFDNVDEYCQKHTIVGPRSYFFSKESLLVWTMRNRWTWRSRGIRMNCVSPGPVETPILKDFVETLGERAEEDMKIMDRAGKPDDIAPVILFLLSDASTWIRGTNIATDGGMSAHVMEQMHSFA